MKKNNIVITGCLGRMGKLLTKCVIKDKKLKLSGLTENIKIPNKIHGILPQSNNDQVFNKADIIIDFTIPKSTIDVLKIAKKLKKKVVIGTTGFTDKEQTFINKVSKSIPILQSGNMSLGINLMQFISKILSKGFSSDYEIEIHDAHHKKKVDYPSGTALMLGHALAAGKNKKFKQIKGRIFLNKKGKGKVKRLNFYIIRQGKIPGTHSVIFKNNQETLEIKHTAHSRNLFAEGAINAAKWLANKKPGLYNMHHVLGIK
tara:strand:- start:577 stop:1353 length:777 start_codon:yes stop_codon:yes gene_type:complete